MPAYYILSEQSRWHGADTIKPGELHRGTAKIHAGTVKLKHSCSKVGSIFYLLIIR